MVHANPGIVVKDIANLTGSLETPVLESTYPPCTYMPIAIAEILRASCTAQRRAPVSPRAPQDILQPFIPFMLSAIASVIKLVNATGNVASLWLSPATITEIPCLHANANMVIIITCLATFYGSTCETHSQIAIPEVGITGLWCELSKCH